MKDIYSNILREALLEVSMQQLKQQFVDSGKVSEDDFKEVETAVGGKSAYATWLLKKVVDKIVKPEDVYKYKDYFNTFERRKSEYKYKDINLFKTEQDLQDFIKTSVELRSQEKEDPSKAKGVDKSSKYAEYKIGSVDGFDVYEIPKGRKDLYGMSCELGSGTEWCTATGKTKQYFDNYISEGPLYIFIKPGSDEKYQFSFEENQFMNKNDNEVALSDHKSKLQFLNNKGVNVGLKIKLIIGATNFTKDELKVEGDLDLYYTPVETLPDNLTVGGDLDLMHTKVKVLPNNLTVGGDLDVSNTPIVEIPSTLKVGGKLSLNGTNVEKLPDNLILNGSLELMDSSLTELPDNFKVDGDLMLNGSKISKLPNKLKVGRVLFMTGTPITKLPKDLEVGFGIVLNDYLESIYGKREIYSKDISSKPEALSESFKLKRL